MAPIVSIIIPVYNRPVLVAEAIESVLAQSNPNWELIVVDDGSTDNTWEVLESYAAKDERIRVFKRDREPKGAPTCRNIGVGMAKGEYLIFWDSDDLLAPWCIEERVKFMEQNPGLDFGLFQLFDFNKKNKHLALRCYVGEVDYLERFITLKSVWQTSSVIWKLNAFRNLEGWDEEAITWQDPEIHIRALLNGYKFRWGSDLPDGVIRSGAASDSITYSESRFETLSNRMKTFSKLIGLLSDNYKKEFIKTAKARIYFETYHWEFKKKKEIGEIAENIGFFSKAELRTFLIISWFYIIFKNLPGLRGLFYRLLIGKHFEDYKFWGVIELDEKTKELVLKKLSAFDTTGVFNEIIKNHLHS